MTNVEYDLAAHESRNRDLVKTLTDRGANPMEKRPIDLHFWSVHRAGASAIAEELRKQGFGVAVSEPGEPHGKWSVEAEFNGSIMEVTATAFIERYVRMAAEHSGEFDGWGTSV